MDSLIFLLFIGIVWSIYYIVVYIYSKRLPIKAKNFDSLIVVHNKCLSFNAKHIYLFKLFYGRSRKKFFFLTTIVLEFIDEKQNVFQTVRIPHRALFESQMEGFKEGDKSKAKLLAFVLQTKVCLDTAVSLRISHDCKVGDLFVYEIRIIDLIIKDSYNSVIQSWIRYLHPSHHQNAQIFLCNYSGRNMTDIKPTTFLNFPEVCLFFILGMHWILFHVQYLISSKNELFFAKKYDHMSTMALTALMAAVGAFLLANFSLILYYYLVKRNYSHFKGIGFIWIVKWSFLFFIVVLSLVFGFSASLKSKQSASGEQNDEQPSHSTLRWLALIIAIVIYTLGYSTLMLCSLYCGYFKDPEEYDLRSDEDKSFKSVRTETMRNEAKTDSNLNIVASSFNSVINESQRQRSGLITQQQSKKSMEPIGQKSDDFKSVP